MRKLAGISIIVLLLAGTTALADWDPIYSSDGTRIINHKMHYPQLPDPFGWDVSFSNGPLGDDWKCSQTGYVDDIHMWVSFREENIPSPEAVVAGSVEIWSNVPAGPDAAYSHPGEPLWGMGIDTNMPNVKMRLGGTGQQGWLEPGQAAPGVTLNDHFTFYQINIDPIGLAGIEPFWQDEGEIYWLVSHLFVDDPVGTEPIEIGWKTSLQHFEDDGVYWTDFFPGWEPLYDPLTFETLDLAFVITPEPATLAVLLIGGFLGLARRAR